MAKIRVLVVDDSVVFRRLISDELSADPELEVVGNAANGKIALNKMPLVNPDLVILDVEMPEMDGLATLRELKKSYPRVRVVMFSALTERGAAETLDALALGADDYFTKPTNVGSLDASLEIVRTELIPEIKALCAPRIAAQAAVKPSAAPMAMRTPARLGNIEIVAIGASTGGPKALAEIIGALPANLPVPIVIAQHMPPMFTRLLAERLTAESKIRVEEGQSGTILQPGRAYIAPGDYHMILVRDTARARILVHQDPPENSCRPSVDVLFRAVAQTFGSAALAVVLTGMGQDGMRGCEAIRDKGGQVIAQDEVSSVVWGMPGAVVRAGLADKVVPLALVAIEIRKRLRLETGSGVDLP